MHSGAATDATTAGRGRLSVHVRSRTVTARRATQRVALLALALALAACVPNVTHPAAQPQPDAPALGTPVSAVRSYLDWTAWSLRTGRAQDASPTMTADEFVRVDAYVEMQRQRGRRVDERLDRFVPGTASTGPRRCAGWLRASISGCVGSALPG